MQPSRDPADDESIEEALEAIRRAVRELRFGAVSLKFHDAKVVQLEVTQKRRL